MNSYLDELGDEILEEIVYEYEDDIDDVEVDEIIAKLKTDISDYIFENPDDYIPQEEELDIDYDFANDCDMPIEMIEKIEPRDDILNCG